LRVAFHLDESCVLSCFRFWTAVLSEVLVVEGGDLIFGVPVLKPVLGGHGPEVVRVPADEPRASLRAVFTLDPAVRPAQPTTLYR